MHVTLCLEQEYAGYYGVKTGRHWSAQCSKEMLLALEHAEIKGLALMQVTFACCIACPDPL